MHPRPFGTHTKSSACLRLVGPRRHLPPTPPSDADHLNTTGEPERNAQSADPQAIKQAYRALSLKWHPDKNKGNEVEAEKRFVEITKAYEACVIGPRV